MLELGFVNLLGNLVYGSGCSVQGTGYRIQVTGYRVFGARCTVFSLVAGISSDVEVQVFEQGVSDALAAEDDLVSEGEKHYVLEFEGSQGRDVTLVLCAVAGPQGQGGLVGLGILGLLPGGG